MKKYLVLLLTLGAYGAIARLLPHPPNFAPITALALVGGLYLPKRMGYLVPIGAMLVSDLLIGFYHPLIMVSVYGCLVLTTYLGQYAKKHKNLYTIVGVTLASSLAFYLITNAMVWAFGALYPRTFTGLMESYYLALPFFKNSLASDLFYTAILVGGIETIKVWNAKKNTSAVDKHHASL